MKILRQYAALAVALLLTAGCSGNPKPETTIAQNTTTIVQAATALQTYTTGATKSGVLPVAAAQKITGYNEVIYARSGDLQKALQAYHDATTASAKSKGAALVQEIIGQLNGPLAQILGVAVPDSVATNLQKLAGNVIALIGAVQAELAKSLGGGGPLPDTVWIPLALFPAPDTAGVSF